MNDPLLVSRLQGFANLAGNLQRLVGGNRPTLDSFSKSLALNKFKHEEADAFSFLKIVDGSDVGVIQRCQYLRFSHETVHAFPIARKNVGQDLNGNIPLQLCVATTEDFSHPTASQQRSDFVRREVRADCDWHRLAEVYRRPAPIGFKFACAHARKHFP